MFYQSFREYIAGAAKIGLGIGVVSLLARWISGNTIFAAPEVTIKFGIIGIIGYALFGLIALITFGFLGKKVRADLNNGLTIGDYLKLKLDPTGYWIMIIIIISISFIHLFLQGVIAGYILHLFFSIPISLGVFLFFLFCTLYAGIGGIISIHRMAIIQITFAFAAVIIIPVYFFIQEGVEPIYNGMRLFHPYLLVVNNHQGLILMATIIFIGIGQIILDPATWQRLFMLEKKKVFTTFTLTGFIWTAFPLAFSSILILVMYSGGFDSIYSIFFDLILKINITVLLGLLIICVLSMITATFGAELHSVISLFIHNIYTSFYPNSCDRQKFKISYLFNLVICILGLVLVLFIHISPLKLFLSIGVIYAAVTTPMIFIIYSKSKVNKIIPLFAIFAIIVGYISLPLYGYITAIWISGSVSFFCIFIYIFLKEIITTRNQKNA